MFSVCADLYSQLYVCVCLHFVCVLTGSTCSALLPAGHGSVVLQQPHIFNNVWQILSSAHRISSSSLFVGTRSRILAVVYTVAP